MVKFTPALTLAVCLMSVSALSAQEWTKPIGRWERKVGKNHLTLIIENNRLHISSSGEKLGALHADYAMTRDGVIYGVVTSIECDEDEEMDASRTLFDAPFTFRFRIDEGALIIHDAKLYDVDSKENLWNGRFKAVRPVTTRAAAVPTSYYSIPSYYSPTPPSPMGLNNTYRPVRVEPFDYWQGFLGR